MEDEFHSTNLFVKEHLASGYAPPNRNQTPRVRFEAIAVGTCLALRDGKELSTTFLANLDDHKRFAELTKSDASNSRPKLTGRIEWIRNCLLGNEV